MDYIASTFSVVGFAFGIVSSTITYVSLKLLEMNKEVEKDQKKMECDIAFLDHQLRCTRSDNSRLRDQIAKLEGQDLMQYY